MILHTLLMCLSTALMPTTDMARLAKEVSTMLSFAHNNVMTLIGVCTDGEMPLIIMPFMSNGSVLEYVRHHKELLQSCSAQEVNNIIVSHQYSYS